MITRSSMVSTVPSDTSRNLLTEAAMMSVPPVEPLFMNTMASAEPVMVHPRMSDMKFCPSPSSLTKCPSASTGIAFWNTPSRMVSMVKA